MSLLDGPPDDSGQSLPKVDPGAPPNDDRLAAVERHVAELTTEVARLREEVRTAPRAAKGARTSDSQPPLVSSDVAAPLHQAPSDRTSPAHRMHASAALSGDQLESLVGRYGTLALAALVILMAVGALIKMAVQHGLLTPEVRVSAGVIVAFILAGAGAVFRGRGEVRYGGVLLALALAVIDLVAWGAGPRFHLVPVAVALTVVDIVAVALAALALHDDSEFLFSVAVAGALSAPFVTTEGGGTALALLLYGGVVLAGALRSARDAEWMRAFAVLVTGALVYALAASALPMSTAWYGPFLVAMFGGVCAAAALLFGEPEWRSELPRAYLAVTVVGVLVGWDAATRRPFPVAMGVALGLAAVTYAALLARPARRRLWTASALLLPFVSLGLASAAAGGGRTQGAVFAVWAAFALAAWRVEDQLSHQGRAGAHQLAAAILGCLAVTASLWSSPLPLVAALAMWGIVLAALGRGEQSPLPLLGVILAVGSAALSSMDQLVSRAAFSYTPFATRSSASALAAAVGIALAGALIARGTGVAREIADRPARLGALIAFLILWGRMELAQAFNRDLASFLLTSYYAACGVASIIAGRRLGIGRLRVAGLGLALYAALKTVVEVTNIGSILLRVSAYAAVGVFLLGAGYLYREERAARAELLG